MYEADGQVPANCYTNTSNTSTLYSSVQYSSQIQQQPLPVYYQQPFPVQTYYPQAQQQQQFYVQQQQQVWSIPGNIQQPIYPQYQYTFQQQQSYQAPVASTTQQQGLPLVNLSRLVSQSSPAAQVASPIAGTSVSAASTSSNLAISQVSPGSNSISGVSTTQMFPVRTQNMFKGARTKARMRKMIQDEANLNAEKKAAEASKRTPKKKTPVKSPRQINKNKADSGSVDDTINLVLSGNEESDHVETLSDTTGSTSPPGKKLKASPGTKASPKNTSPGTKASPKNTSPKMKVSAIATPSKAGAGPSTDVMISPKLSKPKSVVAPSPNTVQVKRGRPKSEPTSPVLGVKKVKSQQSSNQSAAIEVKVETDKLKPLNQEKVLEDPGKGARSPPKAADVKPRMRKMLQQRQQRKLGAPARGSRSPEKKNVEIDKAENIQTKTIKVKRDSIEDSINSVILQCDESIPDEDIIESTEPVGNIQKRQSKTEKPLMTTKGSLKIGAPKGKTSPKPKQNKLTSVSAKPSTSESSTLDFTKLRAIPKSKGKPTVRINASSLKFLKQLKQDKQARQGPSLRVEREKVKFYRGSEEEDLDDAFKRTRERAVIEYDDSVPWTCIFCKFRPYAFGLGDLFGPYYVDREINDRICKKETWLHSRCSLWAPGVVLVGSRLCGLTEAVIFTEKFNCSICSEGGAIIGCFERGCKEAAHLPCAMLNKWDLDEETFQSFCSNHSTKAESERIDMLIF